jgi:hypothetical protein
MGIPVRTVRVFIEVEVFTMLVVVDVLSAELIGASGLFFILGACRSVP